MIFLISFSRQCENNPVFYFLPTRSGITLAPILHLQLQLQGREGNAVWTLRTYERALKRVAWEVTTDG